MPGRKQHEAVSATPGSPPASATRSRLVSHVTLAGAACLMFLAGCTAEREPPLDTSFRLTGRPLVLPLDSYQASPADQALVEQAHAELFRRCMAGMGFAVPSRSSVGPVAFDPHRERYLLADEQAARTRGYHPPAALRTAAGRGVSDAQTTSPGYAAAANGTGRAGGGRDAAVPPGGCAGDAYAKLTPSSVTEAMERVAALRDWSWDRSQHDSRVVAAFTAWSSCMAALGYDYPTPRAANNDVAFKTGEPTPREIATAVADVRCKRRTKVVETWAAVEAAYQNQAIAEHRADLQKTKNVVAAQVAAARMVVRGR
ncbi:hypothetical protein ABGB18_36670 [Nonomuraea sp. B12E4]|uniref:hypothetical protein n=1 Tax=Nonomuraea sp. B12E4 TaxID=3153564 RepID=UPI00325E2EE0